MTDTASSLPGGRNCSAAMTGEGSVRGVDNRIGRPTASVVAELLANVRKASSAIRSSGPNFSSGDMQATWDPQGILSGSGRHRRGWPEGGVGNKCLGANPRDCRRSWAPCLPILVTVVTFGAPACQPEG